MKLEHISEKMLKPTNTSLVSSTQRASINCPSTSTSARTELILSIATRLCDTKYQM